MINRYIKELVDYGVDTGLIEKADEIYVRNAYLELFGLDSYEEPVEDLEEEKRMELPEILSGMLDYAVEKGMMEEGIVSRDLFDTKIMAVMVPRPSDVIRTFYDKYQVNPVEATDYFYKLSQDTNYIRRDRIARDVRWKTETESGVLDISINLSKPEKDPKAIAAAKNAKQSGYPKCLLCVENEGYAGRINHPARQNHRIIPITIQGNDWGFQYSPYVYFNEHCIVFNSKHIPMKIEKATFEKLLDFVHQFPHYFVGSNADLPIVGGSILSHDHFQGGNYEFPMAKAEEEFAFEVKGFEDVKASLVDWPMSVIRLKHEDRTRLIDFADHILGAWRGYTDEEAFIFAETDGEKHNTITPIARKRDGLFELDLVLRNNITTEEHPMGLYHPHSGLHHIKKENIGLIEVMGLAVLPSRLKTEMEEVKIAVLSGDDLRKNETLEKHADWVDAWKKDYSEITSKNVNQIVEDEIGKVFGRVLQDAGVYKCDENGRNGFKRFLDTL
jgi:UDPglucose--hexose-1-phosphate uridylyltransferase